MLQPETHEMIRNAVSYKACMNFQKRSHLSNPLMRRFPQPQNYITNHQTSLEQQKYLDNMALFHVVTTFKEQKRFMKTLHSRFPYSFLIGEFACVRGFIKVNKTTRPIFCLFACFFISPQDFVSSSYHLVFVLSDNDDKLKCRI